jgi:hypothetical protein
MLASAAALIFLNALTDFADVPCQDGVWNAKEGRCIPTMS